MHKTSILLICGAMAFSFAGCSSEPESIVTSADTTVAETSVVETSADVPLPTLPSLPSPTAVPMDPEYVRMMDDVTPEMMNADYWIAAGEANGFDMDAVIMDESQIAAFNDANHTAFEDNNGGLLFRFDNIGTSLDGNKLSFLLEVNRGQIPEDPSEYYLNGSPTTRAYWDSVSELDDLNGVPDIISVRFGFTVKRATLRLFPTEDQVYEGPNDHYFDYMLFSECMPYCPVVVLHESADGNYYYVVFDSFAAWVRKDAVAQRQDREDWMARRNPSECLTVTAREIRLGDDPYCPGSSDLVLPIGTHMELVPSAEAPRVVSHRATYGNYVVKVPTRGDDGYIVDEYVLIPISEDVVVGMMPYTSANFLREAFKLLGDRYGWGGDLKANDCTGIVRELFNVFGIVMPRGRQTLVNGVYKVDIRDMSDSGKIEVLRQMTPGSMLAMPGHMTIYVGMVDDRPYVISSVGTLAQPAPGSAESVHPNSVVLSSLYVRLRSGGTWLGAIRTAMTVREE